jgi:hypothetical protein
VRQAHACFVNDGVDDCRTPTLDGLLTPDGQRRGVWWAYESYGEMSGRMFLTNGSDQYYGLASSDPRKKEAIVLVGRNYGSSEGTKELSLTRLDRVPYLARHGKVEVTVERIPNTAGPGELSVLSTGTYEVVDGEVRVPINVEYQEAVKVTVKRP